MESESQIHAKTSKYWSTVATEEREIILGKEGQASLEPKTVLQVFKETVERDPTKAALAVKRNDKWVQWTYQKYYDEVMLVARAILHIGIKEGQGVSILGFNSPEWFIADLAAIATGGIAAPIYTTNGPEAVHYIAEHSDAVVAFVENEMQLKKFLQVREKLPSLKAIVQYSGIPPKEENVYSWDEFLELGKKTEETELLNRINALKPARCCTLIYTSGTTGPPKAVMLSHDNVTWTARSVGGPSLLDLNSSDRMVSYLPLSHIAAQMIDLHVPICFGYTTYFAQPDALKGSIVVTLKEVRPTLFLGVPRVWEKMQERIKEVGKGNKGLKKSIADWAKSVGIQSAYARQDGHSKPWTSFIANALVWSKVRDALGLDQAKLCASAAAPIAKETLEFFFSLGLPVYEIYGMSECTGPQTLGVPDAFRIGWTGRNIPGSELKIDQPNAEGHGEICYRGRHIFMGYMRDTKATAETIDEEGWLHSGDIGIVKDGFLQITGRIKELIITAGGENIPPVLIEDEVKKEIGNVISNIMVIGDRKKFLSAVVTLKTKPVADAKPNEYPFTDELLDGFGAVVGDESIKTVEQAMASDLVKKYIQSGIDKANKRATSNAQKIQKFEILAKDFTIETGELTPTMKLKRRIVIQQNSELIEKMYNVDE